MHDGYSNYCALSRILQEVFLTHSLPLRLRCDICSKVLPVCFIDVPWRSCLNFVFSSTHWAKFRTGQSEPCPCQTSSMTVEHLLQACILHNHLRNQLWLMETPVARKPFGSLDDPQCMAAFVLRTSVSIWVNKNRKKYISWSKFLKINISYERSRFPRLVLEENCPNRTLLSEGKE